MRVLLVEDDFDYAQVLIEALTGAGWFEVRSAGMLSNALELVLEERFDVMLVDLNLPDSNGLDSFKRLSHASNGVPAVILSGYENDALAREAVRIGAQDYIPKSKATADSLVRALKYAIERQRAAREVEQRERDLRRFEASFQTLIHEFPDAMAVVHEHRFTYVNEALLRALGCATASELLGEPFTAIFHSEDQYLAEQLQSAGSRGRRSDGPTEGRLLRKDGTAFPVEVTALDVEFDGSRAVLAVLRDISERKVLTARMMQMDRMVSVGMLAAGVGHEINNPMSFVLANIEVAASNLRELERALAASPGLACARPYLGEMREALQDACDGVGRVRAIVRDLRTFSRAEVEERGPVAIEDVVEAALNMAWNEIRHRARVVKNYEEVPMVEGNEGRLSQVFLNLIVNAVQAIPEGAAAANEIRVSTRHEAGRVITEVSDTGSGIAEDQQQLVFEPFFSNKLDGQGTGLGLSICRDIVLSLGGEIRVRSTPGEGSTFTVVLPASARKRPVAVDSERIVGPKRRGKLLVVDDEPLIGRMIGRALGKDHDIVSLESAREACERLEAGESFDVVLCDVMMPDMTGIDLFERVTESVPELARRFVFLTGGAFTPRAQELLDVLGNDRLQKPFDVGSLKEAIDRVLRAKDDG